MSERTLSSRAAGTTSTVAKSLCEKYSPRSVDHLTVPPKKLEALCAWLDAASPTSRTVVLLEGPPGCSKSSAVRVLAHERGYDVHEWTPPTPTLWSEYAHLASSFTEVEYSSKVDEFCAFVARATKYTPLSFLVNSVQQQQKKEKKTVLLIRDIPSSDEAGRARILESLRTLAGTSQSPCAVILTEQDDGVGQSNARGGELMNREVRGVMESAGAICVNFNPVTSAAMTKAAMRVCEAERFDIPKSDIDALVQASHGDVRSAMQALEFWCYGKHVTFSAASSKTKSKRKREPKQAPTAEAIARAQVSSRDQGLGLFHALGKMLYNKRDEDRGAIHSPSALADNLNDVLKRPPMTYDPEDVLSRAALGAETTTAFLFENFPDFMSASSLDMLALGVRYMSDAMTIARNNASIYYGSARPRDDLSGGGDSTVDPTMLGELCAGSVATRGVLFSSLFGSSKRANGFLALRGPSAMKTDRAQAANRQELLSVVAAAHSGDFAVGGTTKSAAVETLPALRLLSSASAEGAARVPYLPTKWWRVGEDAATFERRCAQLPATSVAPRPVALAAGVAHTVDRGAIGVYAAPQTLDDLDDADDDIEDDIEEDAIEDDIELDDWEVPDERVPDE